MMQIAPDDLHYAFQHKKEKEIMKKTSALSIVGFILSLIAIISSCFGIGFFIGIVSLTICIVGTCKDKSGLGIAGITLSVIALLLGLFGLSIIGLFSNETESDSQKKNDIVTESSVQSEAAPLHVENEEKDDNTIDVDINDVHLKYIKHTIEENAAGTECLCVYFEYTNNSKDENKQFDTTVDASAFQNGIELEHSIFHVNDETKNTGRDIKPGKTITVCEAFELLSDDDDVEIEVSPWISLSDKVNDSMLLSLD